MHGRRHASSNTHELYDVAVQLQACVDRTCDRPCQDMAKSMLLYVFSGTVNV